MTVQDRHPFKIRVADTRDQFAQAQLLIKRMYAWRGYRHDDILRQNPNTLTLIACGQNDAVIGTVTVGMDSPEGLLAMENYAPEIERIRKRGRKICEFNGLAVAPGVRSKKVLASLFHMATLYPFHLMGYSEGIIEINPSHAGFYERMLGFARIGKEKICPRVDAASVLLHLDFAWANEKIGKVGGGTDKSLGDKTLYPYFFGKNDTREVLEILGRVAKRRSGSARSVSRVQPWGPLQTETILDLKEAL